MLVVVAVVATVFIISSKQLRRAQTRGDVEVYAHASRTMLAGGDIYTTPEPRGNLFYLYAPLFAALTLPLAFIPNEVTLVLWCALNIALTWWIVIAFYRAMIGESFYVLPLESRWIIGFFSILLTVRSILYHLDLAQANLLILAIAVLGLKLLREERRMRAGVTIGISIILKVITLPLSILFFARKDWRVVTGIGIGGIAGLLLPALFFGFGRNFAYLNYWINNVILTSDLLHSRHWDLKFNLSFTAQLYRFFGDAAAFDHDGKLYAMTIFRLPDYVINLLGRLITCAVAAVIAFYGFRYRKRSELVGLWGGVALVFSLVPAFSSVVQKHYFVMLLPAHIYVVYVWHRLQLKDKWFRALVILSFVIALMSTNIFGHLSGAIISSAGGLMWGTLLLAASIFRVAACLRDETIAIPTYKETENPQHQRDKDGSKTDKPSVMLRRSAL